MLDLGFLEDVEKILALTPNGRQTALFSATMPPPIRKLADRYLYDPVHGEGQVRDADRRLRRAVPARGQAGATRPTSSSRSSRAERPDQAIVFVRTKIRCDQLYRTLRDTGHERQGAARRHVAGLARRRDARLQGRPRADPRRHRRRRPRPGHLHGHPRRQLRRPDAPPTSTCTASGAPAASGARAARSRSSSRARSASSRRSSSHIGTTIAPWSAGRARRRRRPSRSARAGTPSRTLVRNGDEPLHEAHRRRAGGPTASRSPTSSTRSPTRAASTARPCATCACSSASRSSPCPTREATRDRRRRRRGRRSTARPLRLEPLRAAEPVPG